MRRRVWVRSVLLLLLALAGVAVAVLLNKGADPPICCGMSFQQVEKALGGPPKSRAFYPGPMDIYTMVCTYDLGTDWIGRPRSVDVEYSAATGTVRGWQTRSGPSMWLTRFGRFIGW